MQRSRSWLPVLSLILLCFISRLPSLLSPHFILDGDECTLALMAKHMLQGKDIPVFFYGQSYGFSLLETSLVSLAYLLGGINDYSVKLAMLALWTTGIVFFYKTLKAICRGGSPLPLLITILFILTPAWAAWSMKARGGYLTSFTLSWIFTYLLFNKNTQRPAYYVLQGFLLAIIYESQPLWLAGILPFLFYRLCLQGGLRLAPYLVAGLFAGIIPLALIARSSSHFWQPQVFELANVLKVKLGEQFQLVVDSLTGYYYLYRIYPPPAGNTFAAYYLIGLICALLIAGMYISFKGIKKNALCFTAFIALLCCLLYLLFIPGIAPRYVLPLSGTALFALCIYLDRFQKNGFKAVLLSPLYAGGLIAMFLFKDFSYNTTTRAALFSFIGTMEQQKINYIFCTRGMLQWQVMYYSGEHIICRYYPNDGRYPEYVQRVNKAYASAPANTAIIGFDDDQAPRDLPIRVVYGYFFLPHPSKQVLDKMEFIL